MLGFLSSVIKAGCSPRPLDTLQSLFLVLDILYNSVGKKATVNLWSVIPEKTGMTLRTTLQHSLTLTQAISKYFLSKALNKASFLDCNAFLKKDIFLHMGYNKYASWDTNLNTLSTHIIYTIRLFNSLQDPLWKASLISHIFKLSELHL